ncbi:hypothetical protein AAG570_006827 [Ranatra chinensis]|uniref:C2H2-type domain-containing protein n=1 Tax=Ranatra chinensis TaxID=642074 RepID=A0ABD0YV77_9HEMI
MASKHRNMFYYNKKQETAEIVESMCQHQATKHCYSDRQFSCKFCDYTCDLYDLFTAHLDQNHKSFACWFVGCNFCSQDVIFLAQHVTDYHGWDHNGYKCTCGFKVEHSFSLGQHKRDKHNAKILTDRLGSCVSFRGLDNIFEEL